MGGARCTMNRLTADKNASEKCASRDCTLRTASSVSDTVCIYAMEYHKPVFLRFAAADGGSFEDWRSEYGKSYSSAEERRGREAVYHQNVEAVKNLNLLYKKR